MKQRQRRKLKHLMSKKIKSEFTTKQHNKSETRVVINLSKWEITKTEEDVLSLGMNYALTPLGVDVGQSKASAGGREGCDVQHLL